MDVYTTLSNGASPRLRIATGLHLKLVSQTSPEIVISTQQNTITKDDEDAMEAAEVLEALSEVNYFYDWDAVNVTK